MDPPQLAIECDPSYVVLLGDVGSGKSTIVESVTGEVGLSSDDSESATRKSSPLWSRNGNLIICDTPGSNPMKEKFEQNAWIATAFNFRPLSKIFIVVRADNGRRDNVVSGIREYSDRFVDLPYDPLGVIVTHMDNVTWTEKECRDDIADNVGIEDIFFSRRDTPPQIIIDGILKLCGDEGDRNKRYDLTVNHENFTRIFQKLHKNTPKQVLQSCKKEVDEYDKKHKDFQTIRNTFPVDKRADLMFEFQAYMKQEIVEAQKRMSEKCQFTFEGENANNEVAHISNLKNQLISIMHKIRLEALGFQRGFEHKTGSPFRKCPHCGKVWAKVEGCDETTICGARPSTVDSSGVMATFTFNWDATNNNLVIVEGGSKSAKQMGRDDKRDGYGCGKSISWKSMQPVELPDDFSATAHVIRNTDITMMPATQGAANFNKGLDGMLSRFQQEMKIGNVKKN